jgi:hypothetical protein
MWALASRRVDLDVHRARVEHVRGDHCGSVVHLNSNEVRLSQSDAAREPRSLGAAIEAVCWLLAAGSDPATRTSVTPKTTAKMISASARLVNEKAGSADP